MFTSEIDTIITNLKANNPAFAEDVAFYDPTGDDRQGWLNDDVGNYCRIKVLENDEANTYVFTP